MRLTIDEYSKQFKMSKEMINSRLRAKRLDYIIEDEVTYIIVTNNIAQNDIQEDIQEVIETKVDEVVKPKQTVSSALVKPRTTVATVLALYQRENHQLKEKIASLEEKIDKLIDDKEQMLREEMQKIEQVYSAKDEQLKSILELVNTKLLLDNSSQTIHDVEALQTQDEDTVQKSVKEESKPRLIELREYIKSLSLKAYQRKMIKKRFLSVYDSDIRIIQQNGKLYLDFSKYDYSDLLEY